MTIGGSWLQFGGYLDMWAHNHISELETFFTPWHTVLYSGFLAVTVVLLNAQIRGYAHGRLWYRALPAGYNLSLLGVVIFAVAAISDVFWHRLFGIEVGVEPLLSPTHLLLGLGASLIYTGPLRAPWRRPDTEKQLFLARMPMVLSLAFLLSSFSFWTPYAHPLSRPWAALGNHPSLGRFLVDAIDPELVFDRDGGLPAA